MPSWIRIRRLLCLAILVSGCYTQPVGSSTQPIKILTLDWTSQVVASHIVGLLLQRLGYPVSYLAEDADSQWFLLSSGQADLQVEVWEGSMASKMNELTRRGLVVDAGTHTALTREEWWYPKYAKAACPGLPDWTALKACAAQFSDGSNELGVYYTGPWEKPDRARIRALGLPFRVVELADAAALRGVLEDAARHTRPVVLFNWTPNWVESVYPGEFVEFPAYAEACETDLIDEQHSVQVAASIGVALFPADDVDADTLLRHADQAMYAAKEAGRGRYSIFDAEQGRRTRDRKNRMSRIEAGLRRNEFKLFFQPKVNMRLRTVVGAEALIRWHDPERGILPPSEFLPLVERHELAIALDDWVIGEAVRLQAGWLAQGVRLNVGVNVSGRYLLKGGLAESVRRALSAYPAVDAAMLELEVLESSALDDLGAVARSIEQCRRIGLSVALDDFGTGYSSLTHLRRLPADILKIDRSFVGEMLTDTGGHAIVEGVIGLSRAFQRQVIAEGVESEAHVARLLELGCELGQGYGIARPMPAEAVLGWIRSQQYASATAIH